MLEMLCSTLNNQPLDPEHSNICPGDFLSGHRAIPLPLQYHDTRTTKRNFEKIREGYEELRKSHEGPRLLTPYIWKTKGMGRVKKDVRRNDVIFIRSLQKLALVKDVSTTQVMVRYINQNQKPQEGWNPKKDAIFLLTGSQFDSRQPPSHSRVTKIIPEKGKSE